MPSLLAAIINHESAVQAGVVGVSILHKKRQGFSATANPGSTPSAAVYVPLHSYPQADSGRQRLLR